MAKHHTQNGAVKVAVLSPKGEILLIINRKRPNPLWCFPGGGVENGETIAEAAVREVYDETGISLAVGDIKICHQEVKEPRYVPHLALAVVDQEVFDQHPKKGDENGEVLDIAAFALEEAAEMVDLVETYRPFTRELAGALASQQ